MSDKVPFKIFSRLDLRVGKILNAEEHPNASKLFILKVNLGDLGERTIVAGLRGHYSVGELVGKKAVFATNLESIKLRGVKSEGMILAAVSKDKSEIAFICPEKDTKEGTKVS